MPRTTKNDVIIPEIFTDAVQGRFAQAGLFDEASPLARLGAVAISDTFTGDASEIGKEVSVPYFGTIGEFQENVDDGEAAEVAKLAQTKETAHVSRDTLAFEATRWSRSSVGKDAYDEGVEQLVVAAARAMDRRVIKSALPAGAGGTAQSPGLKVAAFNATTPRFFDYDLMVEGKMQYGDEQDDIIGLAVHSTTLADLYRLKDGEGRPLLTHPIEGGLPSFLGTPVIVSDQTPIVGSTMGAVTSGGTSPPTIAFVRNTPLGPWKLKIEVVTPGARGTAEIRFSLDNGNSWSAPILTADEIELIDPAIDSLVGVNGRSGLRISYASGNASADNEWSSKATLKATSMLIKRGSFAFWFNRAALQMQTDRDILRDSDVAAMHLYAAACRYRRLPAGTKPGVVLIEHNVQAAA